MAALRTRSYALYLAARDPRTPWYAKAVVAVVAAYAFSPIDLIPDFIPILGLVDDLLLLPLGIALAIRLVPPGVWEDCLARAETARERPRSVAAAVAIVLLWLLAAAALLWVLRGG